MGLIVRRTALGLLIEAVGVNLRAARLAGVNSMVLLFAVYATSGLCAALAGVIAAADIRGADANNAGLWLELDAILAVAIGGTSLLGGRFSILASLIGAMIIQSINTGILLAGFPPRVQPHHQGGAGDPDPGGAVVPARRQPAQPPGLAAAGGRGQAEGAGRMNMRRLPLLVTIGLFLVAYAVCVVQFPNMLSTRVIGNPLADNAYLGIAAVGMTVVIPSGGIDLSVGSVIAFSGVFIAVMLRETGLPTLLLFALLLFTTAFGAEQGALIHGLAMPPFIVTLAGMFLARGVGYLLTIDSVPIEHPFFETLQRAYVLLPGKGCQTLLGVLMLLSVAGGMILAHSTSFGTDVFALGGGEATARVMGVAVGRTVVLIHAFSGLMGGLSRIVFAIYTARAIRSPPWGSSSTPSRRW